MNLIVKNTFIRAVKLIERFKDLTKILDIKLLPLSDVLADIEKEVVGISYEGLNVDKRPTELVKFLEEEKVSVKKASDLK